MRADHSLEMPFVIEKCAIVVFKAVCLFAEHFN